MEYSWGLDVQANMQSIKFLHKIKQKMSLDVAVVVKIYAFNSSAKAILYECISGFSIFLKFPYLFS